MSALLLLLAQAAPESSAAGGAAGTVPALPWFVIPAMLVMPVVLIVGAIIATRRFDMKRDERR